MIWQVGKNPEFTFSAWFNVTRPHGEIAFPFSLSWWNSIDIHRNKNISISAYFLCFGFNIEIWFWNKEWLKGKK